MTTKLKPDRMEPDLAIAQLDDILEEFDTYRRRLSREIAAVTSQWLELGRLGGQRPDHAAELMARLQPCLLEIMSFGEAVHDQVAEMRRDPFGKEPNP